MRTPRPDRSAAFGVPPPALSERALLAGGLYERLTPWHKPDVAARDGRCSSRQGSMSTRPTRRRAYSEHPEAARSCGSPLRGPRDASVVGCPARGERTLTTSERRVHDALRLEGFAEI